MKISRDIYLIGSGQLGFDWTHPADCNVYAVNTGEGVALIDSGTGLSVDQLADNLEEHQFNMADVTHILLTHLHADHSGGAAEIARRTGAQVVLLDEAASVLEAGDEQAIDLPQARMAGFYPADYRWTPCKADIRLQDGEQLTIGRYSFTAMHTPGHSRYDTCYVMEAERGPLVLISGDTIMYGGKISMLSTHDFSVSALASSIERLTAMEPEMLLPGHGQPALSRAAEHIRTASRIFGTLGIPPTIG
ncbi:MBL fold metallo-hydrolase [Paenibacillus sp. 1011MAR3C5]|uniref:MBL fold metallo-hydrolase n=1 Tax=Paenibacillus sp. 1011MAR3C5 TaxID=1675787 RepID=UPI000E6D48A3|nr:MBL fold metallo-hydrolase [Paenibacillus sp. 1011MAR3C5]RJE83010.1 MBL fold metallo-hydrolase [Paenibacillus sp. 1011MAR3C5]